MFFAVTTLVTTTSTTTTTTTTEKIVQKITNLVDNNNNNKANVNKKKFIYSCFIFFRRVNFAWIIYIFFCEKILFSISIKLSGNGEFIIK